MTAITTERDGPMAVITLDSPPLNLFDRAMTTGLIAALDELHDDPPRGLLIRAEGEVVSGGVNVNEFKGLSSAEGTRLWEQLLGLIDRVEGLPFPVVFAAHGLTLTAAFELSLACDLIIASDSARFGLVEIVVGLTPSMGGPQRLAERAGSGRARQLVMTGGLFDAATLERWNVVNEVKPDEELDGYARKLTMRLANGPTLAHAMTKRIVRAWRDEGMGGADLILDMVGGSYIARNIRALADEGRLVQIAFLQGARAEVNFAEMMTRRLVLTGSTLRPQSDLAKARIASEVEAHVWPLIRTGRFAPVMDSEFPLDRAAEAHARMEGSGHVGKIVLKVE